MEVIASDRPGLLSCIGIALNVSDARLHNAKIATFESQIENMFINTDKEDQPITDPIINRESDEFHNRYPCLIYMLTPKSLSENDLLEGCRQNLDA